MDPRLLINGLILYLGLIVLLTFHEFGHAWMAWKCGDDTARAQGRVSLNPLVHMDLLGMSYETYHQIARYGILILILALQIPFVQKTLGVLTRTSFRIIAGWFGFQ